MVSTAAVHLFVYSFIPTTGSRSALSAAPGGIATVATQAGETYG